MNMSKTQIFGAPWRIAVDNETGAPWGIAQYPIGAQATIKWLDVDTVEDVYFSFDDYQDDQETDRFGIPDNRIFFFCPKGEQELKAFTNPDNGQDFVVLDYTLVNQFASVE
jgi:hypothetical protein